MSEGTEREKQCYIVGAGDFFDHKIEAKAGDMVIAADGGFAYLKKLGITADLVIGDFDSLPKKPRHPCVIELEKEKDDTDMMAAIRAGLDKGYRMFWIYGATGGRIDHSLSNLQLLAYLLSRQAHGCLVGRNYWITAIRNESIILKKREKGILSVLSHTDSSEGVTIDGLKYKLHNAVLSNAVPLGVSNEFIGEEGLLSVEKGTLLIICYGGEENEEQQFCFKIR